MFKHKSTYKRTIISKCLFIIAAIIILSFFAGNLSGIHAGGTIFSRISTEAQQPSTPLQEAVIIHDGTREHLIINIDIEAVGDDFAWVVPVPGKPLVKLANPDIFSKLDYISAPRILKSLRTKYGGSTRRIYLFIPLLIAYIYLIVALPDEKGFSPKQAIILIIAIIMYIPIILFLLVEFSLYLDIIVLIPFTALFIFIYFIIHGCRKMPALAQVILLVIPLVIFAIILPNFLTFGSWGMAVPSANDPNINEIKKLVVYKINSFSGKDPNTLLNWLNNNGYYTHKDATGVIKDYIDRGWFFVACCLNPSISGNSNKVSGRKTARPLSFDFESDKIIYPLKITSLAKQDSTIILNVLSPGFVKADKFKLMYADSAFDASTISHYIDSNEPGLNLARTDHFTRLWATFKPGQMEDVVLKPDSSIKPLRETFYTVEARQGSILFLALSAILLTLIFIPKGHYTRKTIFTLLIILSICFFSRPRSLFTHSPFEYRERIINIREPKNQLNQIAHLQEFYIVDEGTCGKTFEDIGFIFDPEKEPYYTYYLSRNEYYPESRRDPYGFFFDDIPELKKLGDSWCSDNGFTAVAIFNLGEDVEPDVWMITRKGDRRKLVHLVSDL